MRLSVIGAGAAGCFCAIEAKRRHPDASVTVYEAGSKPLAKVALTGGGRCNLTNSFRKVDRLAEVYPRGERLMKRAFAVFDNADVMRWFEAEGVRLTVQEDECVFPVSQDSMQIVRTLERLMRQSGVSVECGKRVSSVAPEGEGYRISFSDGASVTADKVVVTVGGSSQKSLQALLPEDIEITPTVPSLYTLKIDDPSLRSLMGTVVENVSLSISSTSFRSTGTLLVTDWGVSGPAVLRLSSYAARHLAENSFRCSLTVNWLGCDEASVRDLLASMSAASGKRTVANTHPSQLTDRLWRHLLVRAGIREDIRWTELGSKGLNRLVSTIVADSYQVTGRAAFKEEFVTCGGVALSGINLNSLESKAHPGLFFAGEALDIDAVTGGFNLQAAWSTAFVVAANI